MYNKRSSFIEGCIFTHTSRYVYGNNFSLTIHGQWLEHLSIIHRIHHIYLRATAPKLLTLGSKYILKCLFFNLLLLTVSSLRNNKNILKLLHMGEAEEFQSFQLPTIQLPLHLNRKYVSDLMLSIPMDVMVDIFEILQGSISICSSYTIA